MRICSPYALALAGWTMSNALQTLEKKVNALNGRERGLMAAAAAVVLGGIIFAAWVSPAEKKLDLERSRLSALQDQIAESSREIDRVMVDLRIDPNETQRKRLAAIEEEIAAVDRKLGTELNQLIAPDQMLTVLRAMLKGNPRLKLAAAQTLGTEKVDVWGTPIDTETTAAGSTDAEEPVTHSGPVLYRHSVELVFTGDYLATIDYLKQVEGLDWKLSWSYMDLSAGEYPVIEVRLRVSTLSLGEGWIGV